MDPLLNHVLVGRIIRIQNFNCLPPPLLLIPIANLKRRRRHQDCQRQALRVHSRLYDLLRRCEIGTPAYDGEGNTHGGKPGGTDDGVAVLPAPVFDLLETSFRGFDGLALTFGCIFVLVVGVAGGFEGTGVSVGGDDGYR